MNLQSMTGFARASREDDVASVTWELRSVNGRGLEARLRLTPGYERLEQPARAVLQKQFSRGNIQASLTINRSDAVRRPVIDEQLLTELAAIAKDLHEKHGAAPATADGLLALRGVLEMPDHEEDEETRQKLDALILVTLDEAAGALATARRGEGAALRDVLLGHIDTIEVLTKKAEQDPAREAANLRARLETQLRPLLDISSMDEARLYQEAAILATKADIREEIDRLLTHVASARSLLKGDGPVGRKLDFLAQEFNREANTLCSKSNAATITAVGLELKVAVDQFREQIQNLE
ncbi:YicC/YloC family endoribonuclease [Nitratireductor aestuarii]|uniref:YicC/YloC family endoribonuclease n=1 Tax=Nitratireductor aestuarii TaxID=1735103 RepID=UPI00166C221C|nr:YicC/YloC family endoribonuclease [Nitratireductor aestuarii]